MSKTEIPTFAKLKKDAAGIIGDKDPRSDNVKTAAMMLSACYVGSSLAALAEFTNLGAEYIEPRHERLTKAGIFKNGKIYAEWADPENGGIAFTMDVMVAEGLMERASVPRKPKSKKIGLQSLQS